MPSWKKVILSGSDAALNSLDVTTNVTATSFTGSLLGTASFATQALSASYAPGTSQTLQQVTDNGNTTTNSITAASFTGSLFGTASYASQALSSSYSLTATSASHALNANNAISASHAVTASSADSFNIRVALTASNLIYPTSDGTANQAIVTDGAGNLTFANVTAATADNTVIRIKNVSGGAIAKGTPLYITASGTSGNVAGVIPADAGNPALMPAGVIAGEALPNNGDEGVGFINGFINGVNTSAFASGDQIYVAVGGGYTNVAPTGSALVQKLGNVEKSDVSNGSGVINGPGASRSVPNINPGYTWVGNSDWVATPVSTASLFVTSASYALTATSASHALTASNANKTFIFDSNLPNASIYPVFSNGTSYTALQIDSSALSYNPSTNILDLKGTLTVTGSINSTSFTGSLLGTASYAAQALTASYANTATSASHALNADNAISSSYAVSADTASFLPSTTNLNITSISASTAVFQSASIGYLQSITGSAKIIGDAFIILNNNTPTERYAGLIVQDSGSTGNTASFQYDGQTNDWFYEYTNDGGATVDFGVALFGPEYNTKGSPTYLTNFKIPKAFDNHHLIDSNLTDSGSRVSSAVPLTVTGSITGSDVRIDAWGSISASLASIEAGVATQNLQDVTDNGNTTTNSIAVTGFTSSIIGGDGITGTFRSTNGYNRLLLISTGSTGTNYGQVNIILRDSSGGSNNDGTITYGGAQTATLSIKTATDNEFKLQGTSTDHVHSFSDGGTGSLVWNSVIPFIQRTGGGQTQFLGLATSASYALTALTASSADTFVVRNNAIITGSITHINGIYQSFTKTGGASVANGTNNSTLFTINSNTFQSVTMDYVVFDSTSSNKRAGTLRGTWDNNTTAVVFDETTTTDIGDTSAFTLNFSNNGIGGVDVKVTNNVGSAMTIIYDYKLLG